MPRRINLSLPGIARLHPSIHPALKGTTATSGYDHNPRDGVASTLKAFRTCNRTDSWPKSFRYQICEPPGGVPKNAAAPANREQPKVASIHFRRTSLTPSSAGTNRCVFLFPLRPQSRQLSPWRGRPDQFADAQKLSFQNCIIKQVQRLNIGAKAKYARHPSEKIRSTPSRSDAFLGSNNYQSPLL